MKLDRLLPLLLFLCVDPSAAAIQQVQSGSVRAALDSEKGSYSVSFDVIGWAFHGDLRSPATAVSVRSGSDGIGTYKEISFAWHDKHDLRGSIRIYGARNTALFGESNARGVKAVPASFPVLRPTPSGVHMLTYSEREFAAPPILRRLGEKAGTPDAAHSGPLALFDDQLRTCIVSPASDFMVSSITEGGDSSFASGLLSTLREVPAGYTYTTLLVAAPGINAAWESWGHILTDLHGKKRPSNEADTGLRYLGYWTDNGASYYYNYDTTKGYEGTLLAEVGHLDSVGIPIRYVQLDSWWYRKGFTPPDGKAPEHPTSKASWLPPGEWNRYGGLLEYVPSPALFPRGLKAFRDQVGVPLITHNRWIERDSPYRRKYTISGIGAVDPRWWNMIADSLKLWGVQTYEQDWQNYIYEYSPEFLTTTWAGEAFFDNMAKACARRGITMQYCMSLPRCYLQGGANYANLTTLRVSGDRFERAKWKEFLYGSRFASALGVWPWADVFMSSERDNLLLATLSGGMVGIGDAYGKENAANIAYAVRPDGVIVKPDVAIVPTDQSVLSDATNASGCRTAVTFSTAPGPKKMATAAYLFSYNDGTGRAAALTRPCDLGMAGDVFVYDFFSGKGQRARSTDSLPEVAPGGVQYLVVVPVGDHGITLIGDPAKFVTLGKERIAKVERTSDGLRVSVLFAKSESELSLAGFARSKPQVSATTGKVEVAAYENATGQFLLTLQKARHAPEKEEHGDKVTTMTVEIR